MVHDKWLPGAVHLATISGDDEAFWAIVDVSVSVIIATKLTQKANDTDIEIGLDSDRKQGRILPEGAKGKDEYQRDL